MYKKSKAESGADAAWAKKRANRRRKTKAKKRAAWEQGEVRRKEIRDSHAWEYQTPEWMELRERIISRDKGRCVACYKKPDTLHVHHLLYEEGRRAWEVPDFYLVSLCNSCHYKEHLRSVYTYRRKSTH